jgi:hypothetical protein
MSQSAAPLAQVPTIFGGYADLYIVPYLIKTFSFLEGPKAALVASKDFEGGHYTVTPQHGIRAFGRVYSAWAYGQTVIL